MDQMGNRKRRTGNSNDHQFMVFEGVLTWSQTLEIGPLVKQKSRKVIKGPWSSKPRGGFTRKRDTRGSFVVEVSAIGCTRDMSESDSDKNSDSVGDGDSPGKQPRSGKQPSASHVTTVPFAINRFF
jgi:hypothetical protein